MAERSSKTQADRALAPPHTRLAIPEGGNGFDILDISEGSFSVFSERLTTTVGGILRQKGPAVPSIAFKEVVENLIHAAPCSASIVLDPSFKNIFVSDTGPGIQRPDLAFELGYSTATDLQRSIIRGVGIGLHLAREDIRSYGGDLHIATGAGAGTYVHIALAPTSPSPVWAEASDDSRLTQRQNNILFLLSEGESLGPSRVADELNTGVSTAHRDLVKLQELGLISVTPAGKRFLSEMGRSYLQSLLSL